MTIWPTKSTPRAQAVLDELVERVEVDVGEELTGQVADRQAVMRVLAKEALRRRDEGELAGAAADDDVLSWVVGDDELGEVHPERLRHAAFDEREQDAFVDRDEEVRDVELEVVRAPGPIGGERAHVALEPARAVEGAPAGDAGAGAGDEGLLEARSDAVIERMVHDAVAKPGRPDFPRPWPADDEARARAGLIGAVRELGVQVGELFLLSVLECARALRIALVAPAIEPGLEQPGE